MYNNLYIYTIFGLEVTLSMSIILFGVFLYVI